VRFIGVSLRRPFLTCLVPLMTSQCCRHESEIGHGLLSTATVHIQHTTVPKIVCFGVSGLLKGYGQQLTAPLQQFQPEKGEGGGKVPTLAGLQQLDVYAAGVIFEEVSLYALCSFVETSLLFLEEVVGIDVLSVPWILPPHPKPCEGTAVQLVTFHSRRAVGIRTCCPAVGLKSGMCVTEWHASRVFPSLTVAIMNSASRVFPSLTVAIMNSVSRVFPSLTVVALHSAALLKANMPGTHEVHAMIKQCKRMGGSAASKGSGNSKAAGTRFVFAQRNWRNLTVPAGCPTYLHSRNAIGWLPRSTL
jgi:hypothetical protein